MSGPPENSRAPPTPKKQRPGVATGWRRGVWKLRLHGRGGRGRGRGAPLQQQMLPTDFARVAELVSRQVAANVAADLVASVPVAMVQEPSPVPVAQYW